MTTMTAIYRVTKTTTVGITADADVSTDVVWQGSDTKTLSLMFPPTDIFGADPLGHSEIDGGFIITDHKFEQLVDGEWQEIDDPRVRLTPPTALEREIDAENRRLFPGDYITEDEEDQPFFDQFEEDPGYDCEVCHDHGCPACDPENFPEEVRCKNCDRPFPDELLNEDGNCADCVTYLFEDAKPRCADCDTYTVENEGDVCPQCQVWREEDAKPRCCSCNDVLTDKELDAGSLCTSCDNFYASQDYEEWSKSLDDVPWWRRLLRWLRLMK